MPGRFSLTVVVVVAALTWAIALRVAGWHLSHSFFNPISTVVSTLMIASLLFDRWGWALPIINKIWHRPDLRGTWKGEISSNYPGQAVPIEAYLSIKQTFSTLVVSQFTQESNSSTRLTSIQFDDGATDSVIGIYLNEPDLELRHRSGMHFGTFKLSIEKGELTGTYWTDRSTQGKMNFRLVCREHSTSFQNARSKGAG